MWASCSEKRVKVLQAVGGGGECVCNLQMGGSWGTERASSAYL